MLGFTVVAGLAVRPAAAVAPTDRAQRVSPPERYSPSYRAFRRMHAKSEKFNQEGWVERLDRDRRRRFRYEIVGERGSDYVRNKVLKALLNREQEIVAGGPAGGVDRRELRVRRAAPRPRRALRAAQAEAQGRDAGRRADGADADGSDLLRVEGRLSKNPSFWTSLVNVIRHFAKLDGVRVPVRPSRSRR